jgi:outer membrane biosynthesis protein TonB
MRTAYIISGIGHSVVLLWSVWSLAARPLPAPPDQALPVDIVSVSDFTKITAGQKSAPKAETPKPLVEKVAEAKPVEDPTAKVVEQKEVKAVRDPAPAPEAKPIEPKVEPKAESKPEKKQAEPKAEKKQAETKPDQIAEALAKDDSKKPEPKKAEVKPPPPPPKKPAPPAPKFDPRQVEALLDKRNATRVAAAGETMNTTASLGLPNASASQMSMSELDALRARLAQLWSVPAGAKDPQEVVVLVRIKLKPDGTLVGQPMVLSNGKGPLGVAARDSAVRALYRGQPFDMLRPEHYEQWKDIEITFDPRDMIRG